MSEHEASMMELIPPAIKERILRLQAENKRLKQGQKQEDPLLQTTIDDLKEREARLEATNRWEINAYFIIEFLTESSENSDVTLTPTLMVDGAEHLIRCDWLAFLSAFSYLQLIQNTAPSTICWCQCDIRIGFKGLVKLRLAFRTLTAVLVCLDSIISQLTILDSNKQTCVFILFFKRSKPGRSYYKLFIY